MLNNYDGASSTDTAGVDILDLKKKTESNDHYNTLCRDNINDIFRQAKQLQETPSPASETLIKKFAIQLSKLRLIDLSTKLNSLNKSIDLLSRKILLLDLETDKVRKVLQKNDDLPSITTPLSVYKSDIDDFKGRKFLNIHNQLTKMELSNFNILRSAVFSYDSLDNLKIFNFRILKLNEFLNYNLIDINQFLESLIKLQLLLSEIFNIELPNLPDLQNLLPNSNLYDLIKQKTNLMLGREEEEELESVEKEETTVEDEVPVDKIVKLGNVIKLPLSAKTRNMQRRSKFQEPRIVVERRQGSNMTIEERKPGLNTKSSVNKRTNGEKKPTTGSSKVNAENPKTNSINKRINDETKQGSHTTNLPRTSEENSTTNSSKTNGNSINKKMIIIPHKILNKPFNKLTIKEFLSFLIIVVKIIINFDTLIGEGEEEFDSICDFEKVLLKILNSTGRSKKLRSSVNLKQLTEHVYKEMIHQNYKSPVLLQELNFSELIENESKRNMAGDWDMVSKMF